MASLPFLEKPLLRTASRVLQVPLRVSAGQCWHEPLSLLAKLCFREDSVGLGPCHCSSILLITELGLDAQHSPAGA